MDNFLSRLKSLIRLGLKNYKNKTVRNAPELLSTWNFLALNRFIVHKWKLAVARYLLPKHFAFDAAEQIESIPWLDKEVKEALRKKIPVRMELLPDYDAWVSVVLFVSPARVKGDSKTAISLANTSIAPGSL